LIDEIGTVLSETIRTNAEFKASMEFPFPIRARITKVMFQDENPTSQTLVDLKPLGPYSALYNVPFALPKINAQNGAEWTPDLGDVVVVQFIDGRWHDPIITGYCAGPENEVQAKKKHVPKIHNRRYHLRCNETDVVIDKDGNRITYIAGNQNEEVEIDNYQLVNGHNTQIIKKNDTLVVHGNIDVRVYGTATVVVDGDTTVTTPNATLHVAGKILLDTPITELTGELRLAGGITSTGTYGSTNGRFYTHGDIWTIDGEVIDKVRAMSEDRTIYNGHTHNETQSITNVPNQQE